MKRTAPDLKTEVERVLTWLKRRSSARNREGMARYGLTSQNTLGVSVADIRLLAKRLGRDHELALALWDTEVYEARMLTTFVDEPSRVTPAQMERWCRDFDSWGICDALCFHLFDRTPHAWRKIAKWSDPRAEFVKRAAFALLASVALHDKAAPDKAFLDSFPLIERAATDGRNFVKKAVSWALRGIGKRNVALHSAVMKLSRRLIDSAHPAARWIGRDALRDLATPATLRRMKRGKTPNAQPPTPNPE
jgi:3-methyladenine DNA glycosylase AlkD